MENVTEELQEAVEHLKQTNPKAIALIQVMAINEACNVAEEWINKSGQYQDEWYRKNVLIGISEVKVVGYTRMLENNFLENPMEAK